MLFLYKFLKVLRSPVNMVNVPIQHLFVQKNCYGVTNLRHLLVIRPILQQVSNFFLKAETEKRRKKMLSVTGMTKTFRPAAEFMKQTVVCNLS